MSTRDLATSSREWITIAAATAVVVAASCTTHGGATPDVPEPAMPPVDVLEGNFAQATYVVEVEVDGVRRVAEFPSDSGDVGYVQYAVVGVVLEVFKASGRSELVSQDIEYRFTQEHDENSAPAVTAGSRSVVFLRRAGDPEAFWVIGNGAQIEASPQTVWAVRQIAARE
ncbi:MAG: hypothetical protein PVG53_03395 [Holophagae bacterium]